MEPTKLTGIRPVADSEPMLGDGVEIIDMPCYKTGEVLVRWLAGEPRPRDSSPRRRRGA